MQKANEGPFLDTLAHMKVLLSGRNVHAYLALFGAGSSPSLLLSLLSSRSLGLEVDELAVDELMLNFTKQYHELTIYLVHVYKISSDDHYRFDC